MDRHNTNRPYVGKRVRWMEGSGKIRRGRPKRRWLDNTTNDLSERELSREDAQERVQMEASHKKYRPYIKVGTDAEE